MKKLKRTLAFLSAIVMLNTMGVNIPENISIIKNIVTVKAEEGETFYAENEDGINILYKITSDNEESHTVTIGNGQNPNIGDEVLSNDTIPIDTINLIIPDTVEYKGIQYSVTGINDYAFANYSSLTSVSIPESVTDIGRNAFYFCSSLKNFNLPENLIVLKSDTFYGCSSITDINIPKNVTTIESSVFGECESLKLIIIPKNVTQCSLTSESQRVFIIYNPQCKLYDSTGINHISYIYGYENSTAQHFAEENPYQFFEFYKLEKDDYTYEELKLLQENTYRRNMIGRTYLKNSANIQIEFTIISEYEVEVSHIYSNDSCSVSIPDTIQINDFDFNVTSISSSAFYDKINITDITFGKNIEYFGNNAFSDTPWLNSLRKKSSLVEINGILVDAKTASGDLIIPNNIRKINPFAFSDNSDITSIEFMNDNTILDGVLFSNCYNLESLIIPKTITTLSCSFTSCFALENIEFPDSLTELDISIQNCNNLKSIDFPKNVTKLSCSFSSCSDLENIEFPDSLTELDISIQNCNNLRSIDFPKNITKLSCSFTSCSNLENITLPEKLTELNNFSCDSCAITKLKLPDNLEIIGSDSFNNCQIKDIEIPKSVNYIGEGAFENSIWLQNEQSKNPLVIVNNILVDATLFDEETITLPDNINMILCSFIDKVKIKKIVLPNNIERINDCMFYGCINLEKCKIPSMVKEINNYAFYNCLELTNIYIPSSVESIGESAFNSVSDNIIIMNPNCYISRQASTISATANIYGFKNSTAEAYAREFNRTFIPIDKNYTQSEFEEIIEPNVRKKYIGNELKRKTTENINVQYKLNSEYGAFVGNGTNRCIDKSVTDVTIPKELKYFGYLYNVTGIADYGFYKSESLENVYIPKTINSIGEDAFDKCPNLKALYILNPNCTIFDSSETISNDGNTFTGTIYGYTGSTAQAYAKKYGYKFISLLSNEEMGANLIGAALTLSGDIGINFCYTFNPEFDIQNTQVILTDSNGNQTVGKVSDYYNEETNQYLFTIPVAAKDMSKSVSLQFINGDILGETKQFSVNDYVNAIKETAEIGTVEDLNEEQTEALVELVNDMKAYGDYADTYFAEKNRSENEDEQRDLDGNDKMQNVDTQTIENSIEDVKKEVIIDTTNSEYDCDVEYYGSSLILESETTIRMYFKINNETKAKGYLNNAKVDINGQKYKLKSINNKGEKLFYIDIENISAAMLQNPVTVKFAGITLKYSPMSFAYSIIEQYEKDKSNANSKLVELCKSLYIYNQSALNYADKQGGNKE